MQQYERNRKKSSSLLTILVIAIIFMISMADGLYEDAIMVILTLLIALLPAVVVFCIVRKVKKNAEKDTQVHSHDRIDHRTDLKINPSTGKVIHSPARSTAPHSQKEHWKQQLDGLLANGTIDKAEYRAMMNRKF